MKFSDAQTSTLAAIQPGDQVTARGERSGDDVTADEIVSGSFRNIAGTVVSTDDSAGTFTVKDLVTKKTVTIKTTPDSDLRKLDPQIAQMYCHAAQSWRFGIVRRRRRCRSRQSWRRSRRCELPAAADSIGRLAQARKAALLVLADLLASCSARRRFTLPICIKAMRS